MIISTEHRTQNTEHRAQSTEHRAQNTEHRAQNSELGTRNSELKKVAKEMEALFAYQLIKVMRETANNISSNKKGVGYNTYMSLFDMEVSRLFADRGLGLQDALIRELQGMAVQPRT